MDSTQQAEAAPVRVVSDLTMGDLRAALSAGWADFRAFPAYGLFFGAVYVLAGLFLTYALLAWGQLWWLFAAAGGFPLVGPLTAVGLYEVSRRREGGLPIRWGPVLGAIRGHGDDQITTMAAILFVGFAFWLMLAHGIFAIFLAESGIGGESIAMVFTLPGMLMLLVGSVVGGLVALAFYAITIISLPLLVDREVDFLTAVIASLSALRGNGRVMLGWAAIIALALFAAMIPLFLGLLVVLPVLGHATWHLYRRAVTPA